MIRTGYRRKFSEKKLIKLALKLNTISDFTKKGSRYGEFLWTLVRNINERHLITNRGSGS
jgi:hypothetical protein